MKSNLFLRVIILLFCIQLSVPANAEVITEQEARQWASEKGQQLIVAFGETDLAKKYTVLDEMFVSFVDLKYVSKFVIGKYWRQMSEEQRNEYQELFQRYALSIYKSFPLDYDSEQIKFDIVKVMPENNKTTVRAKIDMSALMQDENTPMSDIYVDFILKKDEGKIKIIDLKLGESSLILSYRSRFYEMIIKDDNDITWFLEDLSDITEAAERTNQEKLQQAEY